MSLPTELFIGGSWVKGAGSFFQSINPATQDKVWEGNGASSSDIDRAIKAAQQAFSSWSLRSLEERISFLLSFGAVLTEQTKVLAEAISIETGKPLWESKGEVQAIVNKIAISIDSYKKRCADIQIEQPHIRLMARHKPHGVLAVFGPFNFPGHLPNGHIIPALLAGNTIVFKPSEYAPRVAQLIVQFWELANLPPGVLNLLQGGKQTGAALSKHPGLDGLLFTGSFATGLQLSQQFATHPEKILSLELGGNNPLIVSDVADLKMAALQTVQSAYITSGQRCSCARRLILIQNGRQDQFLTELQDLIARIRIGPYTDIPEAYMGPVISLEAAEKLMQAQDNLAAEGGKILVEMRRDRAFLTPGLLDVTSVQALPDVEHFGPLALVIQVPDLHAAIVEANNTRYGLSAGLLSESESEYQLFYSKIKAGIVNWNTPTTGGSSALPFSGIKQSGNHRPTAYYAADSCSYPVASQECPKVQKLEILPLGFNP